jgi:small-conductance mechanosensitive channel
MIGALFPPSLLLSWQVEPKLEEWARRIKGMPGLLRLVVVFLRRLEWLFFVILLAAAYVVTTAFEWPESNYLIYSSMLLAAAWLAISVVSHVIRSRVIGRMFGLMAWVYVATAIFGITDEIAALMDGAGFTIGTFRFSVLRILQAVLFLGVLLWLSTTAGNFLDRRIQQIDELTPSLRVLIGKILRISLIIVAAMVAMSGLGIDLTAFTVLSGAVGVGIGFGLQKVVSNFISGIIILMDESIKPGDTISLGETFGWIRELRARFVSVVTRDGREFLIPNEDFITREVINWSFSDKFVRIDVPFGVSYDADPHEVIRIAIEAGSSVDRVDGTTRPPVCWLTAFGDSSLDFLLRFWISDPQKGLTNIRGKVLMALWDAFKEHDIGIPYPHREIIMKPTISSPD